MAEGKRDLITVLVSADLIEVLLLFALEIKASTDDLLGKLSTHDQLHDWLLLVVIHVLVYQILQTWLSFLRKSYTSSSTITGSSPLQALQPAEHDLWTYNNTPRSGGRKVFSL